MPYLSCLTDFVKIGRDSKFCGEGRVENFERFLNSRQARHVALMTKTAVEFYDVVSMSKGAPHDSSLDNIPARNLKGNIRAQMAAEKFLYRTGNEFASLTTKGPIKRNILKALSSAIKAINNINYAAAKGKGRSRSAGQQRTPRESRCGKNR